MKKSISNNDNVIDSRDVIERIEELTSDLQAQYDDLETDHADLEVAYGDDEDFDGKFIDYLKNDDESKWLPVCKTNGELIDFDDWIDKVAEDDNHTWQDEAVEWKALTALADEAGGYGDWAYGESLINEDYWMKYAQELAEDIGAINKNASWPNNCIDWSQAADDLQVDYSAVDFDGTTFYMRS